MQIQTPTILTPETAPEKSKTILQGIQTKLGFVPNLLGIMAASPQATQGYLTLSDLFEKTSFNAAEKQVVLLTVSYLNQCTYCMAAHTMQAVMMQVPQDITQALREGTPLANSKLEALRQLTASVVTTQGRPSEETLNAFYNAGYKSEHLMNVILGVSLKTLSNYINHIVTPPLDEMFEPFQWQAP